jgi:hypothetical protein
MSAGRLVDQLRRDLGTEAVFMDIDTIAPGVDFVSVIAERLSACKVFIAVIGPGWLGQRHGVTRRIFRPGDFVRLETFAALNRDILVIPVLVGGATMPAAAALPKSIADITLRNAVGLSTTRFLQDVDALAATIRRELEAAPALDAAAVAMERARIETMLRRDISSIMRSRRGVLVAGGALAAGFVGLGGLLYREHRLNVPHYGPQFAPVDPDPTAFAVQHPSEAGNYAKIDELNREHKIAPLPFPRSRGGTEPILTLAQVLDVPGDSKGNSAILDRIVFHAVGCTGAVRGPQSMDLVADQMTADLRTRDLAQRPAFLFHLGDVIYDFGEMQYYFDQFYVPWRYYRAPIVAIAGNHDGMVVPGSNRGTLDGFLANFCAETFGPPLPAAGGIIRTPQIQPGVYFTFEAPYVRILALYSNVLEAPGVLADERIGSQQLDFLTAALERVRQEKYKGALLIAHHHPAYTAGSLNGWSQQMRQQIDTVCHERGVWPHAVLSAHAHNYQRFTRTVAERDIPYIIAGNGGHGTVARISRGATPLRVPLRLQNENVVLESYDDQSSGYLTLTATATRLTINYKPVFRKAPDAAASAGDTVTVDLASGKLVRA